MCGYEFKGIFKDVDEEQYEFHNWVPTVAHPYKQALLNSDIAILPLKDDLFNRCKSAIKWVEYSSLGIPSVAVNIPPYSPEIEYSKTGFLYNNPEDFEDYSDIFPTISPLYFFLFLILIFAPIRFKILIQPILVGFTLTFLITNFEL